MNNVSIDFNNVKGKIKVMHAVNNGPVVAGPDQTRGNQNYFKAARIPYARTHDASFWAGYGGSHTIDVHSIFPNFYADADDENSYDFACTDLYIKQIFQYGSKPFYRLGSKIEHEVKKYGTVMPPDFKKWAIICEHIIAHYTKGWANGFNFDIEYWETDLDPDESTNKRCWSGTEKEFAEFYAVAATHLKACFPDLKIGGPASCGDEAWMKRFLDRIKGKNVPLDFLSWHWYWTMPEDIAIKADRIKGLLIDAGYENSESILNEWNYVRDWSVEFVYSIKQIIGMKGAAFTAACMSVGQHNENVDMLMYYDARPGTFNGLFDYYTMMPLKGYYPFFIYSKLYELENCVYSETDDELLYAVGATDGKKIGAMVTYYSENDNVNSKTVTIELKGCDLEGVKLYLVDEDYSYNEILNYTILDGGKIKIRLERNSILYIER